MIKVRFQLLFSLFLVFMLTACNGSDDIPTVPDVPENTQAEQTEESKEPDNKKPSWDSLVVDMLPKTQSIVLTAEQREFAQRNNDFSFKLYRAINEAQTEKKSNITSPLSVTFLLGMLNDGAAGCTGEEITKMLGFGGGDKTALNEYCKALIDQAPLADPSVILQIANLVAVNNDVALDNPFQQHMKDYYSAEVTGLDFSVPASLEYLNAWCNKKTEGMIPKILEELDPQAKLVLMNAIYFKATWAEKFDEKDTQEETFILSDGKSMRWPMMHRKAEIIYGANDLYSSILLPYGSGDRYSMYVLLPVEGKTVDDIINSLTIDSWEKDKANKHAVVDIKLPRFSTNSDILLNDVISKLGASSMFDSKKADFSCVSNNYKHLYVSLLKQKAAIEVSEEGTKTSAVTVASMAGSDIGSVETAEFHANRPFVYIIQEWGTKAIFFIGTFRGE